MIGIKALNKKKRRDCEDSSLGESTRTKEERKIENSAKKETYSICLETRDINYIAIYYLVSVSVMPHLTNLNTISPPSWHCEINWNGALPMKGMALYKMKYDEYCSKYFKNALYTKLSSYLVFLFFRKKKAFHLTGNLTEINIILKRKRNNFNEWPTSSNSIQFFWDKNLYLISLHLSISPHIVLLQSMSFLRSVLNLRNSIRIQTHERVSNYCLWIRV